MNKKVAQIALEGAKIIGGLIFTKVANDLADVIVEKGKKIAKKKIVK